MTKVLTKEEITELFSFHNEHPKGNGGQYFNGQHCEEILHTIESLTAENELNKSFAKNRDAECQRLQDEVDKLKADNEELRKNAIEFAVILLQVQDSYGEKPNESALQFINQKEKQ